MARSPNQHFKLTNLEELTSTHQTKASLKINEIIRFMRIDLSGKSWNHREVSRSNSQDSILYEIGPTNRWTYQPCMFPFLGQSLWWHSRSTQEVQKYPQVFHSLVQSLRLTHRTPDENEALEHGKQGSQQPVPIVYNSIWTLSSTTNQPLVEKYF